MVLVGLEGDLVGEVGVETGAGLCCNEATANWGHPGSPLVPGVGKLLLLESEGGFFGNETVVVVNVGE